MTGRVDFREGRRLGASDLNGESAARAADLTGHLAAAHPGGGLVGASVTHPTGHPSVAVTPQGPAAGTRIALHHTGLELELGVPGGHHTTGSVVSERRDVRVLGAVRLASRPSLAPSVPWSVRAVDVHDDGGLIARELRIELAPPPGSPPQQSRVAVGTVEAGDVFRPLMTVDAAGTVTIEGDLEVAGSVSQGEIPPDPEDPRFVSMLANVLARRIVGASATSVDPTPALSVSTAGSTPDATSLTIALTPTVSLSRWGAALEIRRGGTTGFRLLGVGGPAAAAQTLTVSALPVPWAPPLSAASPGRIVVAVVGFDAQGVLRTHRTTTSPLTG